MTPLTDRPRTRLAVLAALVAVTMSQVPATSVLAHGPDPLMSDRLFGQDQDLEFRWRSGSEPPAAIKTAIRDAAAGINDSHASRAPTFSYAADGDSPIGYGTAATCGVNGIACFTRSAPNSFTMWLREHGRVFDWGTLRWCQMYDNPPNGCYDAETIALDEFGHVEVLAHHVNYADDRDYLDAVVQTYSRTRPKEGWDEHVLGRCDVATLQREYDVPSSSTKVSTCLDLDTAVTLTASVSTVSVATTVKFASTFKVASNVGYDRLSGNALSGRTIRLQRRTPGTTTWVTVATMAGGSTAGTYGASTLVSSTTEFRALYSVSTAEGLNGDGSAILTIARIASCAGAPCLAPGSR